MTVSKITSPITPNELIDKTNEIIDNLGGSAPSNMVTTDTQQTISAIKTWTGQQFIKGGVEFGYTYTNRSRGAFNFGAGSSKQPNAVISPNGYIDLTGYGNATTNNIRLDYYTANTLTIRRQLERGTIDNGTINIWSGNTEAASSTKFKLNKNGVFVNNNKVLDASSVDGTTITYNSTTGKISSAGGGVDIDNTTITQNSDDELQTVAVIDNNSGNAIKTWTGTKAEYDAIAIKDSTTLYFLSDVGKIYFGDTLISNIGNNTLLDFKWADHQLNDIQWLRADTFSWQDGTVHNAVYTHLVSDIQGITAETETVGNYTVTFYRATDGHKICLADQEQTVLNIYNTYGIAWYYILDTTNTQFKLPRTKYGFEGLRTNVGDYINESLPNITGILGNLASDQATQSTGAQSSGALYWAETQSPTSAGGTSTRYGYDPKLDASRSSSAYQDNAPVQERATQMYLYFYVGDYTQTAIEQTAGLNAELFNNKADLNLANVNDHAKTLISGMGMPSDTRVALTLGASGTSYTAPANGWVCARVYSSNSGQQFFVRGEIPGGGEYGYRLYSSASGQWLTAMLPVKKGTTFNIYYGTPTAKSYLYFQYAVGSESEAS